MWIIGTIAFFGLGFKRLQPSQTFSDDGIGGVWGLILVLKCHYMLGVCIAYGIKPHSL